MAITITTSTKGAATRMIIEDHIMNTNVLIQVNIVMGKNSSSPAMSFVNLVKIVPIEFVS